MASQKIIKAQTARITLSRRQRTAPKLLTSFHASYHVSAIKLKTANAA